VEVGMLLRFGVSTFRVCVLISCCPGGSNPPLSSLTENGFACGEPQCASDSVVSIGINVGERLIGATFRNTTSSVGVWFWRVVGGMGVVCVRPFRLSRGFPLHTSRVARGWRVWFKTEDVNVLLLAVCGSASHFPLLTHAPCQRLACARRTG